MKLLFDQNLSFRLVKVVQQEFPGSTEATLVGLKNASDIEIWQFARTHDFAILTYDSDFHDISVLRGHPPKIIWLRIGSMKRKSIEVLLMGLTKTIHEFLHSDLLADIAVLEIIGHEDSGT